MKSGLFLVLTCTIGLSLAYTQNDLLTAQYNYQSSNDKLTSAIAEKKSAATAVTETKQRLNEAQQKLKKVQQEYQAAQNKMLNAESNLVKARQEFSSANLQLNQVWHSLNPE